jgi:hypothetical protein
VVALCQERRFKTFLINPQFGIKEYKAMLKPKFSNVLLFLAVKYIVFFVVLAFIGDRFKSLVVKNSENTRELISNTGYYSLYILLYTFVGVVVFSLPLYFTFKVKSPVYFILLIAAILVVEYLLYTNLASTNDLMNGVYNGIVSILFLLLFFYRHIVLILRKQAKAMGDHS